MIPNNAAILESVRSTGLCRLGPTTDAEYRALVGSLGRAWCETAVELRPDVRSYLCRPEPVPFHTDHPEADFIAWRCEQQDHTDGSQQLIDGWAALEACGRGVRDALTHVHAEVKVRGDSPASRWPIVRASPHGDRLFYADWIKPIEADPHSGMAFDALKAEIGRRTQSHVEEVRLSEGEVLIINNGRYLHGRKPLASDSQRRLRRFWITA
ncbi:MAG: TauD/TfdA family dioxygenase [Phycisphaeraceae bacterium]|nr:TauD/TfdA family dioxygenase [Phycisphaeraceae bacterium]MBX3366232.1 TauD/TfdA family dioxygenase [Phycisphaeraceae bacterium]QYK48690.1 MAG: TauD/TfdA family dioxygenase [Phycisphaeraceae bacterium]